MKIEITPEELNNMEIIAYCANTSELCQDCPIDVSERAECTRYEDINNLIVKALTPLIKRCKQAKEVNDITPLSTNDNTKHLYVLNYDNGDDARFIKLTDKEFLFLSWFIKNYGSVYFKLSPIEDTAQEYCETLD